MSIKEVSSHYRKGIRGLHRLHLPLQLPILLIKILFIVYGCAFARLNVDEVERGAKFPPFVSEYFALHDDIALFGLTDHKPIRYLPVRACDL